MIHGKKWVPGIGGRHGTSSPGGGLIVAIADTEKGKPKIVQVLLDADHVDKTRRSSRGPLRELAVVIAFPMANATWRDPPPEFDAQVIDLPTKPPLIFPEHNFLPMACDVCNVSRGETT